MRRGDGCPPHGQRTLTHSEDRIRFARNCYGSLYRHAPPYRLPFCYPHIPISLANANFYDVTDCHAALPIT